MIKKIFDYWSMWHLLLATYAFLIIHFQLGWDKQTSFIAVLALAIVYEASEWIWNRDAYEDNKSMLKNNLIDIGMTVLALFITLIILI